MVLIAVCSSSWDAQIIKIIDLSAVRLILSLCENLERMMERASGTVDSTTVEPLPGASVTGKGEDTRAPSLEGKWMTHPYRQHDELFRVMLSNP